MNTEYDYSKNCEEASRKFVPVCLVLLFIFLARTLAVMINI